MTLQKLFLCCSLHQVATTHSWAEDVGQANPLPQVSPVTRRWDLVPSNSPPVLVWLSAPACKDAVPRVPSDGRMLRPRRGSVTAGGLGAAWGVAGSVWAEQ